jgi:hypothetical protein
MQFCGLHTSFFGCKENKRIHAHLLAKVRMDGGKVRSPIYYFPAGIHDFLILSRLGFCEKLSLKVYIMRGNFGQLLLFSSKLQEMLIYELIY